MRKTSIRRIMTIAFPVLAVAFVVIYLLTIQDEDDGPLRASGSVEAVEVIIASELAGRVQEVFVEESSLLQAGDPILRLDDELFQAQRDRAILAHENAKISLEAAQAAVETAEAALLVSQANADLAQIQYEITLAAARMEQLPVRRFSWTQEIPDAFTLPIWYFQKSEELSSAKLKVDSAFNAYNLELKKLEDFLKDPSESDLSETEKRLLEAQVAFSIAEDVLDRAKEQNDDELQDFAQSSFETAESELEAAQNAYDDLLSESGSQEILEVRARVAVTQEHYETALDRYYQLRTGEYSFQVQAAEAALVQSSAAVNLAESQLAQAKTSLRQAEKSIEQALAEVKLLDIQINKLVLYATTSGIVRSRNIEPGEVLQPGATAVILDRPDTLTITVYIPEDKYGLILLGSHAQVEVDSFPNEVFDAVITRIADRAEFTPRNVQTEEGRRTTVFAVQLSVMDNSGKLKPGMPADVTFN